MGDRGSLTLLAAAQNGLPDAARHPSGYGKLIDSIKAQIVVVDLSPAMLAKDSAPGFRHGRS